MLNIANYFEKFKNIETPFYFYNIDILKNTLDKLTQQSKKYNYHIHYALKANANDRLLEIIKNYGVGADCVSGNEVSKAAKIGFDPQKIVFAGVGKSDTEINTALNIDIFCFNVESIPELEVINELAGSKNKKARIAIRINPNVAAKTHHYITTGLEENKFGINMFEMDEVLTKIKSLKNLELIGLHFHIGSQIKDFDVFKALCNRINEIQQWFNQHRVALQHINVGGGMGFNYRYPDAAPDFEKYFSIFNKHLQCLPNQQIHFEPGRIIVAQCGDLITRVLYVKKGVNTNFVIVDAGMTELIRPALYQAVHKIENLSSKAPLKKYDVVGPICESSDCFGKALMLPETKRNHFLAIRTAGAYGEVMSMNYNLRGPLKIVFSDEL